MNTAKDFVARSPFLCTGTAELIHAEGDASAFPGHLRAFRRTWIKPRPIASFSHAQFRDFSFPTQPITPDCNWGGSAFHRVSELTIPTPEGFLLYFLLGHSTSDGEGHMADV